MIQTLFGSVEQEPTLLEKLKSGVQKTREGLVSRIEDVVSGRKAIDADLLEELEYTLISADIGVNTTNDILERIRERVDRKLVGDSSELRGLIREYLLEVLQTNDRPLAYVEAPPAVIMLVGVNGAGKTTTIGKLAAHLKGEGRSVLLCAADTFRAAAIEQLEVWGERTGIQVIRQNTGADPSAVMFDALSAAKARQVDYVIIDTAGRLQTKTNLMLEDVDPPPNLPPGYELIDAQPRAWTLRVTGQLGGLPSFLVAFPVADLAVEEAGLEDVLVRYYREVAE